MLGHVATSVGAALPAVSDRGGKPAQFFDHGNGTWTAPANGIVTLRMVGGGGGGSATDGSRGGGGGGAFSQKRFPVRKGQSITGIAVGAGGARGSSTSGSPGGATVCTLPDGSQLQAGGGRGATGSSPAAGGVASGGDVNNSGGVGGKQNTTSAASAGNGAFGGRPGLVPSGPDQQGFTGGGPGGPNELFPASGFGGYASNSQDNSPPTLGGGGGGSFGGTTFNQNGASGYFSLEFTPS